MAKNDDVAVVSADGDGGAIIEIGTDAPASPKQSEAAPSPDGPKVVEEVPTPVQAIPDDESKPRVSEAVEELRSQLQAASDREAAANRERLRAEQIARQRETDIQRLQQEARHAQDEVADSRRSEIDSGILAAQAESDASRRQYQSALESGDFAAASEANLKVNRAVAQLVLLEDRKASFEATPRQATQSASGRIEAPQQQNMSDPAEQFIQSRTPRTQGWLRKHMDCVTDTRMNNRTVGAHYEAVGEGYVPDTDAYFDYLDRKLGFSQPAGARMADTEDNTPPKKLAPKQAPPAAPVSRESPRSQELGNGKIYLTRGELETAEALGISPAEYGKRKQAMTKQGFYH